MNLKQDQCDHTREHHKEGIMSNCDLCNKLEFEKNLQEQKGSWLCPSCYNTYDDEELEEKLQ